MRHTEDAGFEWHLTALGCGTDASEESPPVACGKISICFFIMDYKVILHSYFYLKCMVLYLNLTPFISSLFRADAILGVEGLGTPVRPEV